MGAIAPPLRRLRNQPESATHPSEGSLRVLLAKDESDSQRWDAFVDSHPESNHSHRWGWKRIMETIMGWPTCYLIATQAEEVHGIVPLVWQKSWLFGSFVSSMPFLNAGGILARCPEAERALLEGAVEFTKGVGAEYLELRHRCDHGLDIPLRTNKLTLIREVQADEEQMFAALDKKVRSDVRKSMKSGFAAQFGGQPLLDEFYRVFAVNMRNLGTPVYSRVFFQEILRTFPNDTHVCVVRQEGRAAAASFLIGNRDTVEAVWSASLSQYRALKPNMFLYWSLLCYAAQKGYRYFDFGRSSVGSGTHRFKLQWAPKEVPLHWAYWLAQGSELPALNPENPKYRLAIWLWQRLPLSLTKWIGPKIVRCLP